MPIQKVFSGEKQIVPVKCWTDEIDLVTEVQLRKIAQLPFIHKHVSAMPDAHLGKGSTVGSVIATKKAIIPAAVGVDIGCGMAALKTSINYKLALDMQWKLYEALEASIPLGAGGQYRDIQFYWPGFIDYKIKAKVGDKLNTSQYQLGTLGSGNHFIEICHDTDFNVWIMIHSGSRGIGNLIASEHIKVAEKLMKEWHISLPDRELAYLIESTPEFKDYMDDLSWAQEYARMNREVMMNNVIKTVEKVVGEFSRSTPINCHHNYTEKEHHFGEDVWLTRKGAIRARQGDMGIIPGSMGDRSYIVRGKGCADAFCSAPHGAGRKIPRKQADKLFTEEDAKNQTEGVACRKDSRVFDELPTVYKSIDKVMEYSDDLVEVVTELKQFVCVKG